MTELIDDRDTLRAFKGFPVRDDQEPEDEEQLVPILDDETPSEPEVDLHALARKIYALLKQELALERERLTSPGRRRQ
jgi:hypothetical protein